MLLPKSAPPPFQKIEEQKGEAGRGLPHEGRDPARSCPDFRLGAAGSRRHKGAFSIGTHYRLKPPHLALKTR